MPVLRVPVAALTQPESFQGSESWSALAMFLLSSGQGGSTLSPCLPGPPAVRQEVEMGLCLPRDESYLQMLPAHLSVAILHLCSL